MKVPDARTLSSSAQEAIRVRAVISVEKGQKIVEVARQYGVSRKIVGKWWRLYKSKGLKALNAKTQGRPMGSGRKLLPWQAAQVAREIIYRYPDQLDIPFVLWSREAVQQLIFKQFQVSLDLTTVGDYLKRWGFTAQKPARRSLLQDSQRVQQWKQEIYPQIQARARKEQAVIYWEDEMGVRLDHSAGLGYSKKGKTPLLRLPGTRLSCHIISAITNQGALSFMVFEGTFTTTIFLTFLKRLVKSQKRKIFLILDGHPVHHAKCISLWLSQNQDKIELFFIPPYSPELNPDEFLNQDFKSNVFKSKRPKNKPELIQQTREWFYSRQKHPHKISGYFHAPSVKYAS